MKAGIAQEPTKKTKVVWPVFVFFVAFCRVAGMHPLFAKADRISRDVIGAAIEVHRLKGPGLIESIYERCLMRELNLRGLAAVKQRLVRIEYKGLVFEEPLRFDVLVEDCLLLELKSVQEILPIHHGAASQLHEAARRAGRSAYQLP